MPTFLFNLRHDSGSQPFIVSCSIVGDIHGFSGVVRRFETIDAVITDLRSAHIAPERYVGVISQLRQGTAISFDVDLNEAQKLAIIQTDTSE